MVPSVTPGELMGPLETMPPKRAREPLELRWITVRTPRLALSTNQAMCDGSAPPAEAPIWGVVPTLRLPWANPLRCLDLRGPVARALSPTATSLKVNERE